MLTLFVRFMLWDSRKIEKNQKTAVYLLNAQKQTQIEKHIQTVKSLQNQTLKVYNYIL